MSPVILLAAIYHFQIADFCFTLFSENNFKRDVTYKILIVVAIFFSQTGEPSAHLLRIKSNNKMEQVALIC